ncbi:hypothetical protein CDL15_Pgr020675 [Punica granatum]|uniref:Uncharacterized protein n=1 Tax=Punica granatum TaxID=22663 RepID=A0A218XD60_PUNGR|nr:hypothetical protein CDL15_Pgr020675 [Punica granatum]
MRCRIAKVGSKPDAVNVGLKPDAGPKPNVVNVCSIGKCKKCESKGCLLVGDFLQWKKETMKEHELFAIPMQECREANWPGRRRASTPRDVHRYTQEMC